MRFGICVLHLCVCVCVFLFVCLCICVHCVFTRLIISTQSLCTTSDCARCKLEQLICKTDDAHPSMTTCTTGCFALTPLLLQDHFAVYILDLVSERHSCPHTLFFSTVQDEEAVPPQAN